MDEKELIDGLRGLTLTEPRLGFDPDRLADRSARKQRTFRQLLATAAGTLVVVGMAVGTLLFVNAGESLPVIPGGGVTTTTKSRSPTTTGNPNKPDMTKQIARIRTHLQQVLPPLLPGARDLRIEPVEQAYDRDYVMAVVRYRDTDGVAGFNISVLGPVVTAENVNQFKEKCDCDPPITQPDGSKVYIEKDTRNMPPGAMASRHAAHYRNDRTMVSIYHDTALSISDAARKGGMSTRTTFPLTEEQLIALVTDPALNVR